MNLLSDISFLPSLFVSLFFSILFLQSGLDKVFNFKSNLSYFKDHFKETFLINFVHILLVLLVLLEVLTGSFFILFLIDIFLKINFHFNFLTLGIIMANFTICCLFLGQRLAQDYLGAVNLAVYFVIALLSFLLIL